MAGGERPALRLVLPHERCAARCGVGELDQPGVASYLISADAKAADGRELGVLVVVAVERRATDVLLEETAALVGTVPK